MQGPPTAQQEALRGTRHSGDLEVARELCEAQR